MSTSGNRQIFDARRDLVRGEKVESEMTVHPLSQLRSYLIGFLVALAGYYLISTATYYLILVLIIIYLVYASNLQSVGNLIKTGFKAVLGLYGLFVMVNFLSNIGSLLRSVRDIVASFTTGRGDQLLSSLSPFADPAAAASGFLTYADNFLKQAFSYIGPYVPAASIALMAGGVYLAVASFFYTGGQRVYLTDRRVIITKKFGGTSMFQATMDSISDVSCNRGIGGRLLGYGAIYLTTSAGTGVRERDEDKRPSPARAIHGVKLTVDGVKDPEQALNLFVKLRMEFIEALHLKEIKDYTRRTAEALDRRQEQGSEAESHGAA